MADAETEIRLHVELVEITSEANLWAGFTQFTRCTIVKSVKIQKVGVGILHECDKFLCRESPEA